MVQARTTSAPTSTQHLRSVDLPRHHGAPRSWRVGTPPGGWGPACHSELTHVPVHSANPLGILVANLLSPTLVKKEEDIPLMVRELRSARM